jgi:hypothetical protein
LPTSLGGAHPKIKAWPSKLGVGHKADNLIMEKMIMLRSPQKDAGNLWAFVVREVKATVLRKKKRKNKT